MWLPRWSLLDVSILECIISAVSANGDRAFFMHKDNGASLGCKKR